MEYVGQKSVL